MTDTIKEKDRQLLIEFQTWFNKDRVRNGILDTDVNDFFSQRESREEKDAGGIYQEYNLDDFPTQKQYQIKCFDCGRWGFFYDNHPDIKSGNLKCPYCKGDYKYKSQDICNP